MTKYDDFDWHAGDAIEKGQLEDGAFTHIGFILAWLIRRGVGNVDMFEDYAAEFGGLPDYGVSDDPAHEPRIDRRIEEAYKRVAWRRGRQRPIPAESC
jgi:hypothetical protein